MNDGKKERSVKGVLFPLALVGILLSVSSCGSGEEGSPLNSPSPVTRSGYPLSQEADPHPVSEEEEPGTVQQIPLGKEEFVGKPQLSQMQHMERQLHQLVNNFRKTHGLQPLIFDEGMARIARKHSQDMLAQSVPFGHDGAEDRFLKISQIRHHVHVGEVVAANFNHPRPVEQALKSWQDSPGHRKLLLTRWEDGGRGYTGIGVSGNSKSGFYFTQIFLTAD